MLLLKIIIVTIDSTKNDTYMKESEFVSDTFAEHDTNEINEIRKSLKESLGVESSENGKSKKKSLYPKNHKLFY